MTHSHRDIANDAKSTADQLSADMQNARPDLHRVIEEVDAHKKSLPPTQFKEYLNELNKDLTRVLPGLTIEGTMKQLGQSDLIVKNQTGGESFLDRNDGGQLKWMAQHHPTVEVRPDGTRITTEVDGTRESFRKLPNGETVFQRSNSPDHDNETVHTYPNGRQVIQRNGATTDTMNHGNGAWESHGTGPRANDNFHSQRSADGHFSVKYADGRKVEAFHGQVISKH